MAMTNRVCPYLKVLVDTVIIGSEQLLGSKQVAKWDTESTATSWNQKQVIIIIVINLVKNVYQLLLFATITKDEPFKYTKIQRCTKFYDLSTLLIGRQ